MSYENPQGPAATPAGWYPDNTGQQRYWDGNGWTDHVAPGAVQPVPVYGQAMVAAPTQDEITMATLCHALAIFFGFLAPLIILLVKGDQSVFVKHHTIEALNFAITVFIAGFVSALLILAIIGLIMLPIV